MTIQSIRNTLHSELAQTLINDVQYQKSNYYFTLGKVDSWGISDTPTSNISTKSDNVDMDIRNNIMFGKKITPNDVSLVINRYDWEYGVIFDKYDSSKDMSSLKFYCITPEYDVYKCLDNSGGLQSTVKPTNKSFSPFTTSDGYVWKYMYTVPNFKVKRFLSNEYIPVQRALSDSFYNRGSISSVNIVDSGIGYENSNQASIIVEDTSVGSGATIVPGSITVDSSGAITGLTIGSGGVGYTHGAKIVITSSTGSGAIISIAPGDVLAGVIQSYNIEDGGSGYTSSDVGTIVVGGAVIVPVISRFTGSIVRVDILDSGAGYSTVPQLSVVTPSTGHGVYDDNPDALIACKLIDGKISHVYILDPGAEYPAEIITTLTVSGDGDGALLTPIIHSGKIIDVLIESGGEGYTTSSITINGAGTGAQLLPVIGKSDFISNQSVVEQTAVKGSISAIEVSVLGENYTTLTTVSIVGDGVGCTATPIVVDGKVSKIRVDSYGYGYNYANVLISDPSRTSLSGIDALAYPIISPDGGHGSDAITELFGNKLALVSSFRQESKLLNFDQEYRQFSIIKNPVNILNGKYFTESSTLVGCTTLFNNVTNLAVHDILLFGSYRFMVIDINGLEVTLQQLGNGYITPIGVLTSEANSTNVYTSKSIINYPTLDKYSGKLLYVANDTPFAFTPEQGIILKTILKF